MTIQYNLIGGHKIYTLARHEIRTLFSSRVSNLLGIASSIVVASVLLNIPPADAKGHSGTFHSELGSTASEQNPSLSASADKLKSSENGQPSDQNNQSSKSTDKSADHHKVSDQSKSAEQARDAEFNRHAEQARHTEHADQARHAENIRLATVEHCNQNSDVQPLGSQNVRTKNKLPHSQLSLSSLFREHYLLNNPNAGRLAKIVIETEIAAPVRIVKEVLSDFHKFPTFMKRVKTCNVTRQEGTLYYTESYLKPQFLVNVPCNHTITDVCSKPNIIDWALVDGNFESACGRWELLPGKSDQHCKIKYTVALNPGPLVPANIVSLGLKIVQKELVSSLKERAEQITRSSALTKHSQPNEPDLLIESTKQSNMHARQI